MVSTSISKIMAIYHIHLISSLGQLIKIIRESQMETVLDRLIELSSRNDEEIRDIAGLGNCEVLLNIRMSLICASSQDDHR